MDNNEIRRKTLEILYNFNFENPPGLIGDETLQKELLIDKNLLDFNINYLDEMGYVDLDRFLGGEFLVKITSQGINIVENNEEFNRQFPISITQNIITNSNGVVINSSNVSINIHDAFNKIYQQIEDENPTNKDEILEKVNELEQELQKEDVNKLKVQNIYDWLKRNANWIIPSIIQIGTASLFGAG